jgi:ribosome-binding protein aMBF1 (putative translation factor)
MGKPRKKNKDKFDIQILSHVTQDLKDRAIKAAEQKGWTLSQLGREAIEKYVSK